MRFAFDAARFVRSLWLFVRRFLMADSALVVDLLRAQIRTLGPHALSHSRRLVDLADDAAEDAGGAMP